jgi:hypothetical protein
LYRQQIRHIAGGSEAGRVPSRLAVRELRIVGQLAQISIRVTREHLGRLAILTGSRWTEIHVSTHDRSVDEAA